MNTAALRTFAPAVRRQLMEAVTRKLDYVLTTQTPDLLTTYAPQVASLRKLEEADRTGLIERVAYTWFNRLAALRFLDARSWHPFRARVLTPASAEETQPELLKLTRTGALPEELHRHTNPSRLNDLLDGKIPSPDAQGEVYRSLVLAACHFYHALLPDIFEKLDDETELLLPDDLLTEHSIVHGFRTEISDEDCGEVELLGWLYQFYISEKKDQVMARKSAVPTEDIPAVTQLFTPHWIVRYLVENSLGRLWLLNHPQSKLRDHMPYYIEGEENAPGGSPADFLKITKPEEIRLVDPASGSGHILTYAFDLLVLIYEEEGYAPNDIPGLILRHNLCGLDICPRAAQLAELALVFKAREKSRRFFQPEHLVRPNIIELREVRFGDGDLSAYFKVLDVQPSAIHPELNRLLHQFDEAKNFGSLIQPCMNEQEIQSARSQIANRKSQIVNGEDLLVGAIHAKVLLVLKQAEALTQRYQIVVANPPYMGTKFYNAKLKVFAEELYSAGQPDSYGCFMQRNVLLAQQNGYAGMITIPNWMFISSFAALREVILGQTGISSLIYNGRGVWGPDFGSCAFSLRVGASPKSRGVFRRLFRRLGEVTSNEELIRRFNDHLHFPQFQCCSADFQSIPGKPLAFWITASEREKFIRGDTLENHADTRKGLDTGENERFLRFWHEVNKARCSFVSETKAKWFPDLGPGVLRLQSCATGFLAEAEMQVSERVTGFKEKRGKNETNHMYGPGSSFNQQPLTRFIRTTGVCWFFPQSTLVSDTVANRILEAFCEEYSVQPRDLGIGRFHAQNAPGGNSPVNGVCIFDNSNGSLRLTERLAANFSAVVSSALATEKNHGNADLVDALEGLLVELNRAATVICGDASAGVLSDTPTNSPDGWQRVIAPGSKAILTGISGTQEVTVLAHVYTPSGLQYQLQHPNPTIRWMIASDSLELINGVTPTMLYNVQTGELKNAE